MPAATPSTSQATVETFVGLYTQTIADQAERLDQFTRMAAHEWRQPLGALQFGVRLLRDPAFDRSRSEAILANVDRSVHRLIELTEKLETIARVRSNGDNVIVQSVSLSTVAQEAARQLREMADARGVEIRVSDGLPTLTVDVGRLELAFVNLLSNAIKYSDPDKIDRYVEIAGEIPEDGWLHVTIRDNGIGIPATALAGIFERFTRAHADDAQMAHVSGIGLGLSIVEDCVRAMGGRIQVQSVETEGTTFTLKLPTNQG